MNEKRHNVTKTEINALVGKLIDHDADEGEQLAKRFGPKFRHMSDEAVEKYDRRFVENIENFLLNEFYGGYHPRGPRAAEKTRKFIDYFYMFGIVHPERVLDERDAQILYNRALEYANDLPKKERMRA